MTQLLTDCCRLGCFHNDVYLSILPWHLYHPCHLCWLPLLSPLTFSQRTAHIICHAYCEKHIPVLVAVPSVWICKNIIYKAANSIHKIKVVEYDVIFSNNIQDQYSMIWSTYKFTSNALNWVLKHSSNSSVKEIVFEGVSGLLHKGDNLLSWSILEHDLFPAAVLFALDKLLDMASSSTTEDDFKESPWFRLIQAVNNVCSITSRGLDHPFTLSSSPLPYSNEWREQIQTRMEGTLQFFPFFGKTMF